MGVQLNIKDAETVLLARDLAKQLNKTVTQTIREALEAKRRESNVESERRLAEMMAFADEAQAAMPDDVKKLTSREIMDSIYGDDGLPE